MPAWWVYAEGGMQVSCFRSVILRKDWWDREDLGGWGSHSVQRLWLLEQFSDSRGKEV